METQNFLKIATKMETQNFLKIATKTLSLTQSTKETRVRLKDLSYMLVINQ